MQTEWQKAKPKQNARTTTNRRRNGAGEPSWNTKNMVEAASKKIVTDITFNMPLNQVFHYAHAPSFQVTENRITASNASCISRQTAAITRKNPRVASVPVSIR